MPIGPGERGWEDPITGVFWGLYRLPRTTRQEAGILGRLPDADCRLILISASGLREIHPIPANWRHMPERELEALARDI
jgi:hypothetical protein